MPSHQTHRGPAPEDTRFFAARRLPALRSAAAALCWLLDRGYASRSALELVGNRHDLTTRQRMAVSRYACSIEDAAHREQLRVEFPSLSGQELWLDGYNILSVLETALAGGIIIFSRDGCCRDIAGIHKRYRKVSETIPALDLVGKTVSALGVSVCRWWLDQPVSNSGRLKTLIRDTARKAGWNMEVELTFSPDHVLSHTPHTIATSDGIVLDRCQRWVNLTRAIITRHIPKARILDFSTDKNPADPAEFKPI